MDKPAPHPASDDDAAGSTPGAGGRGGRRTARRRAAPAAAGQVRLEGGGLRVERQFTTAGVHPFDEVQWERRTASIGNEKGETVFEQKDVEIPASWSQMATNVVVSKYFRGPLNSPRRETSVRQVISRVCDTIAQWGREGGYFATEEDAQAFNDELTHLVLHQRMAFNSPVWFNVGVPGTRAQASACFINSVEDTMDSILTLAHTEGMLFKYGSGTGTNLSTIRSSVESLAGGGTASGPVSFMRGFDAFAGVIKSGGTTRRAAKMVILNADHPDVEEFITCKVTEERKAWALIDAGYDGAFTGEAYSSIFFQNSNNSVRVTDEFMRAVIEDRDWQLRAVTDPERIIKTVKAREMLRLMAESAWHSGDPGIQYDTTINDWHTSSNSGRINASNPCCFVGATPVETSAGVLSLERLESMSRAGDPLPQAISWDILRNKEVSRDILRVWVAGTTGDLVEVRAGGGQVYRCTPEHRFLTAAGQWVPARDLAPGTRLRSASRDVFAQSHGVAVAAAVETVVSVEPIRLGEPVAVYDLEVEDTHNFAIGDGRRRSIVVHNSEYLYLDDSACNLASLNLMTFVRDDGTFDVDAFRHAIHMTITAQEILVTNASYPTPKIAENSENFRPLGLGYANLGALLMARGAPYDSPQGRELAACVTAMMTGEAYAQSARIAREVGPFNGFAVNRRPMLRVIGKHREAAYRIPDEHVETQLITAARRAWDEAHELGAVHGYRNGQATVLAPTGCLTPDSLVMSSRGLVRMRSLGDPNGEKWQDVEVEVATDQGPRQATKFFVNGVEPVVTVETRRGYRLRGTTLHRIRVVDSVGMWQWRRLADLRAGDRVPLMRGGMLGEPVAVTLPPLGDLRWIAGPATRAPRTMTAELAEFIGYFMGDGSLHAKGIRLCVTRDDADLVDHLVRLTTDLFGITPMVTPCGGYTEIAVNSVPLTVWWDACGFAKLVPETEHRGKGYGAHIPDAVLHSNDPLVYGAFVRGLFEAEGTVSGGYVAFTTANLRFSRDIQTLLLALGMVSTRKTDEPGPGSFGTNPKYQLRLLNVSTTAEFGERIGFISSRKQALCRDGDHRQAAGHDHVPLRRDTIERLARDNDSLRRTLLMEHRRSGTVTRRAATELLAGTADTEVASTLDFYYDEIASATLGEEEATYDLSVPDNVTYVANGFVSHNTIGFLMDCDTTGVEPDIALVKYKKLVGGGMLKIVNQTVPLALRRMGYGESAVNDIVAHIDANDTIEGAPHLREEDLAVFDCAFKPANGSRSIAWQGHVRMMSAVQPFLSGAISKCVTGETLLTTHKGLVRIGSLHCGEDEDSFRPLELGLASLDGKRITDAYYFGGRRPVMQVRLRSGHRVTGTPNHRLLVSVEGGLEWRRLDDLQAGDRVATQYGDDMWSETPFSFADFAPSLSYGSQKRMRLPNAMTDDLAYLLGAYAAEGHLSRSNYTVRFANTDEGVISRLVETCRRVFEVTPAVERTPGKCPSVNVSSKRLVEFLDYLGCGSRAADKRIPDSVLRSPKSMVLAFLQGLSLDAYIKVDGMAAWAICLDSSRLLDDLQAVLTNLGIVHSRVSKYSEQYEKSFGEVYACGREAQKLVSMVPFMEPHKQGRVVELLTRAPHQSTADVVPGINGRELFQLIPAGSSGRSGAGTGYRQLFRHLVDRRTAEVSWESVRRVATLPGVQLPEWLEAVVTKNLHFSPVREVGAAGEQDVYDISVPVTHAFVGNGVVNHNTVNMPAESTAEDVEQAYLDGWKMGLKALAIYRDGSKRSQPMATTIAKTTGERQQIQIVERPLRRRLPAERQALTHKFEIAGHEGYITVGLYEDGSPGEIFLKMAKEGSTISGLMDSFATAISMALQYGVPLKALTDKFSHARFEPSGFTGNPEIPIAKSVMDYIFRWLASRFLPWEDRDALGIVRRDGTEPGEQPAVDTRVQPRALAGDAPAPVASLRQDIPSVSRTAPTAFLNQEDAPSCGDCGSLMVRSGACYKCLNCGATSGCS